MPYLCTELGTIMPTFFIIGGVKIELYFDDHAPPHFHAIIGEYDALIEIETSVILKGDLPRNKKKLILKWAQENRDDLKSIWNDLN